MAKDSPRITAGELQRLVEYWDQKAKKKKSNSPYITTYCSGGFQEKLSLLIQKQTQTYSVVRHDWNFKWDWLLWLNETKKNSFFGCRPTRCQGQQEGTQMQNERNKYLLKHKFRGVHSLETTPNSRRELSLQR